MVFKVENDTMGKTKLVNKRVAILKKKNGIIINIYVLDIPKYSFIISYSDN
jgi:hypothetical protein